MRHTEVYKERCGRQCCFWSKKTVFSCLLINVLLCIIIAWTLFLFPFEDPKDIMFVGDYNDKYVMPLLVFNDQSSLPFYLAPVVSRTNGQHRAKILYNIFIHKDDQKLKEFSVGKRKKIVFHNPPDWVRQIQPEGVIGVCAKQACEMSYLEEELEVADAVIFDQNNIPQVHPTQRTNHQAWVLFGQNPSNISGLQSDLWKRAFNWTMTHRLDSDIVLPYHVLIKTEEKRATSSKAVPFESKRDVLWISNTCSTLSLREKYVEELKKHIPVDVVGLCSSRKCQSDSSCKDMMHSYKLYIAFEEEYCVDYVTEEYFQTFISDVIPVVRGGAHYSRLLPQGTFINTADFETPARLAEYLAFLSNNRTAYEEYVSIKNQYRLNTKVSTLESAFCDLCVKLHNVPYFRNRYYDVAKWLTNRICHTA